MFPAATGAPPDRPLTPGDRWSVERRISFEGQPGTSRLRSSGRLVELGVTDGRELATITARTQMPVRSTVPGHTTVGARTLTGTQATRSTVVYDLADGAADESRARTTGRFRPRDRAP